MEKKQRIISICGNIGSGKSTLIHILKNSQNKYNVVEEPLSEMSDLLQKFYNNISKWAFHLQCKVLLLYSSIYKKAKTTQDNYIIERSPTESKHIFCKALTESNLLTSLECSLYNEFYDELSWEPDCFLYIKTPPDVCFERIKLRNRDCEKNMSIEYICQLNKLYIEYFEKNKSQKQIFIIDGSLDIDSIHKQCIQLLNL